MAIDLIKIKSFPSTKNLSPSKLVPIIKLCNQLRVSSPSKITGDKQLYIEFDIDFNSLKSYHGSDVRSASGSILEMISSGDIQDVSIDLLKNKISLKLDI